MTTDKNPTDKQTPLEGISRRTGQQSRESEGDQRPGAKPESPSSNNASEVPGSPNQGTDSR